MSDRRSAAAPAQGAGATATDRWRDKIVPLADLSKIRQQFRDRTIVLCHGAFDLVHMGHLIHFEDARALGDLLVVTVTADKHITKKRAVSMREDFRARQVASLEIVDYVAIVDEPSAAAAIEALRPDVYVKGPEYSNLLLDKTSNISHEKTLVESYGGRIHFTSGETFSSTKLSHFLLVVDRGRAGQSPAPQRSRDVPRHVELRLHARGRQGISGGREPSPRLPPRRNDHRRVGRRVGGKHLAEVALRRGTRNRRVRQIGGAGIVALHLAGFVKSVHCFTNGLTCGRRAEERHGDAARRLARS